MDWVVHHELSKEHLEQLERLYETSGMWWTRGRTPQQVRRLVAGSDALVALCDPETDELLGFARALTDGVIKALILDVAVDPKHRGSGLGRAVMNALCDHPTIRGVRDLELYCLDELVPFYEHLGFSAEVGGVRLMRR